MWLSYGDLQHGWRAMMTELSPADIEYIREVLREALAFTEKYIILVQFIADQMDVYPRIHRDAKIRKLEVQLQDCISRIEAVHERRDETIPQEAPDVR